ncbi:MAG: hypothetical protein JO360_09245 [Acidobacteria bacterium]|nr:hypothetical protein [Acidobacteriota bacterium]
MLALLLPVAACAYTVVMHGGHSVEIPDRFEVTGTALTYETANGIYVTLQMSSIDIAATERANGEPAGSLLRRAGLKPAPPTTNTQRATRTLTNLDLEPSRQKRLESEAAYERRRVELGLPSREEMERRRDEENARARELMNESAGAEAEAESYWRSRATELRNEIYALDAELNYVHARLNETSDIISTVSYATIGSPVPFIFSTASAPQPPAALYGIPSGGRTMRPQVATRSLPSVRPRTSVFFGVNNQFGGFQKHRQPFFNQCRFAPCFPNFVSTYPYNYDSYDRSYLLTRFRELEGTRAGLLARWRILEDEARRAGAQPGWLRP